MLPPSVSSLHDRAAPADHLRHAAETPLGGNPIPNQDEAHDGLSVRGEKPRN